MSKNIATTGLGALLITTTLFSGHAISAPRDGFIGSGANPFEAILAQAPLGSPSLPQIEDLLPGNTGAGRLTAGAGEAADTVTGVLVVVDDVGTRVLDVVDPVLAQVVGSLSRLVQTDIPRLTHELNQATEDLSLMEVVEALQWIGREWEADELLEVVLQDAGGSLNLAGILEAVQDLVAGVDEQTATELVGEILEGLDAEELEGGQASLARAGARAGGPARPVSHLLNRVADTARTTTGTVNSLLDPVIEQGPQQVILLLRSVPEPVAILLSQALQTGHGTVDNVLATFAPRLAEAERQRLHPAIRRARAAADDASGRLRTARRDLQRRPKVRDFRRELDRRRAIAEAGFVQTQRIVSHGLQGTVTGTGELAADLLEGVAELPRAARRGGPEALADSMAGTARETAGNTADILTIVLIDTVGGVARTGAETTIAMTGLDPSASGLNTRARAEDVRRRLDEAASRSPLQVNASFDGDGNDGSVGGELSVSFDTNRAREMAQSARERAAQGARKLRQAARSAADRSPVQFEADIDRNAGDGTVGGALTVTIDVMPDNGGDVADAARQAAADGRQRLANTVTEIREQAAQRREQARDALQDFRERGGEPLQRLREGVAQHREALRETAAELRDRAADRRQDLLSALPGR